MSKVAAVSILLATVLGGWLYGGLAHRDCLSGVDALESAYRESAGGFGYGEMTAGLKNATAYCEIGDEDAARQTLAYLAQTCRSEGGCS